MISTTTHSKRVGRPGLTRHAFNCRGFTLTEVMVASTLSLIVLAGVMTTFLMIGRSGASAANYSMAETEVRRGIEEFSQDLRMASAITWNSATSVTLTVPNNYVANGNQVTYAFDASTSGATAQSFYRLPGDTSSVAAKTKLVSNISAFAFERYNRLDATAANDAETKRIQITLNVRRTGQTLVAANTVLVSASYILRNKPVH